MKILFLAIIIGNAQAMCEFKDENIRCKSMPCMSVIDNVKGTTVMSNNCQDVYVKRKGVWEYDHTSVMHMGLLDNKSFAFETKIYKAGR